MIPIPSLIDRIRPTQWKGYPKVMKNKLLHKFLKINSVSDYHPETKFLLRSLIEVYYERKRHFFFNRYVIHPLSAFRMFWQFIMCLIWIIVIPGEIFVGSFVIRLNEDGYEIDPLLDTMFGFNCICKIDIILNFLTGYYSKKEQKFILNPKHIAIHYLTTYFFIDMLCFVGIITSYVLPEPVDLLSFRIAYSFQFLRLFRLISLVKYMKVILQFFGVDPIYIGVIRSVVLGLIYVHVTACILCFIPDLTISASKESLGFYSWVQQIDQIYMLENVTLLAPNLYMHCILDVFKRYNHFLIEQKMLKEETIVHTIIRITTLCLYCYFLLQTIYNLSLIYNNSAHYSNLINELSHFMKMQDINENLQTDIMESFKFNFRKQYFAEPTIMDSLLISQKEEIHNEFYQKFLIKSPLLQNLSKNQVAVLTGRLKWFCLVTGHVINIRPSTRIMYFVLSGTLAAYEGSKELMHYKDGDCFGENVTMSRSRRALTNFRIIALENCSMTSITAADYEVIQKAASDDYREKRRKSSVF